MSKDKLYGSKTAEEWVVCFMIVLLIVLAVLTVIIAVPWIVCGLSFGSICSDLPPDEVINIFGGAIGGVLVALGLVFLNRRAKAMDKSAEASLQENQQTLFSTAIGHLGDKTESVRLGGIYALYELATSDATKEKYCKTVHEILCAHIRSKTNEEEYKKQYVDIDPESKPEPKPSTEIQILLDILTKEPECRPFQGLRVDFRGAQLRGAYLKESQLQSANLFEVQLQSANLSGAQLKFADLGGAQLQSSDLSDAQLQSANLGRAQLESAYLSDAQLQSADLRYAQMQSANLSGAQLQSANLSGAQLQSAYLSDAQLQGANLSGVQLRSADLIDAQLQSANLTNAQLRSADLSLAQLQSANLYYAQLQGANLKGIQLAGATSSGSSMLSFIDRMKDRVGKPPELDNVIFDDDIDLKQWEDQTYTVEQAEKWIKEGDLIYFMSVSK